MNAELRLAPFYPIYGVDVQRNWPRWLQLKHSRLDHIDRLGANFTFTYADGSYEGILVTTELAHAAIERSNSTWNRLFVPSERHDFVVREVWYYKILLCTCIDRSLRERLVRYLNTSQKSTSKHPEWGRSFGGAWAKTHMPFDLIFDTPRFQAHGPQYFHINRKSRTLQLRADAPIVYRNPLLDTKSGGTFDYDAAGIARPS
ncbi:MAG: hypothetical protein ABI671_14110 [Burkholderiales bacterium]